LRTIIVTFATTFPLLRRIISFICNQFRVKNGGFLRFFGPEQRPAALCRPDVDEQRPAALCRPDVDEQRPAALCRPDVDEQRPAALCRPDVDEQRPAALCSLPASM